MGGLTVSIHLKAYKRYKPEKVCYVLFYLWKTKDNMKDIFFIKLFGRLSIENHYEESMIFPQKFHLLLLLPIKIIWEWFFPTVIKLKAYKIHF